MAFFIQIRILEVIVPVLYSYLPLDSFFVLCGSGDLSWYNRGMGSVTLWFLISLKLWYLLALSIAFLNVRCLQKDKISY